MREKMLMDPPGITAPASATLNGTAT